MSDDIKSKIYRICPNIYYLLFVDLLLGIVGAISLFYYLMKVPDKYFGFLLLSFIGLGGAVRFICKFNFRSQLIKIMESID